MTSDAELCKRLAAGDRSAVAEFLDRDYAVVLFYARVLGGDEDAAEVVAGAAEEVVLGARNGQWRGHLRAALMVAVTARIEAGEMKGQAKPISLGTFLPTGDPWEGWWDVPPRDWPAAVPPTPDQVLAVLRRLPLPQRRLLTLVDVVGLSAEEVTAALDGATDLDVQLEAARDAYLVHIDREMSGR